MHLMHLTPEYVDTRMTVKDFHIACDWIDSHNKAAAKGGR